MSQSTNYHFSWQNPFLRASIYPFRNEKLRDFLLIYYEIDLWERSKNRPPDPGKAGEIQREYTQLDALIVQAKLELQHAQAALKVLEAQHRQILQSEPIRLLQRQKNMLLQRRQEIEARMLPFERQVDWYQRFAPEHPYLQRYEFELSKLSVPMQEVLDALNEVDQQLETRLADYLKGMRDLESQSRHAQEAIARESARLRQLPKLDARGQVSSRTLVQWEVARYRQELELLEHDELVTKLVELFDAQSGRFPVWLQYMVLHFSGMRYRSAHGSWADVKDLLEMLQIERLREKNQSAADDEIAAECLKALDLLNQEKSRTTDRDRIQWIDYQMMGLMSLNRRAALLKYQTQLEVERIQRLTQKAALQTLKEIHARDPFPDWVWAEIVSRTELRLEVQDDNWEELTEQQRQSKWLRENTRWREIMNTWQSRDITGWRKQHWLTLSLIVTRAVCNEIAEHIQHLRGVKPAAGLTAKPTWYLNQMRKQPAESFLRRPATRQDFPPGASILFLGWTDRKPNAWQIALALPGIDILPETMRPAKSVRKTIASRKSSSGQATDEWTYRTSGSEFFRTMRPYIRTLVPLPENKVKKLKKQGKSEQEIRSIRKEKQMRGELVTEWLRWTHEATVIEVAELTSGTYVLTFETGKIGINLRPIGRLVNAWDIFVGFTPPASVPEERLEEMLDRKKILARSIGSG